MLCEKEFKVGGLVSSFYKEGVLFDAGVRGIVDSGIVRPFLNQLGIKVEFVNSVVTIGIEDELIRIDTVDSLNHYRKMLFKLFPDNRDDIDAILEEIIKVMDYMDVLYGIENPLFMDLNKNREYIVKTLLPWLFKFLLKSGKIKKFNIPVNEYLSRFTDNKSLIDIISQHFFQKTPASFALSYFSLYLDYEYPVNGTSDLVGKIEEYILKSHGTVNTRTEIKRNDPSKKIVYDQNDRAYEYEKLIWAADQNLLYKLVDQNTIKDDKVIKGIEEHKNLLKGKRGGDSIYSLFLIADMNNEYFQKRSGGHCFYTPKKIGQSKIFEKLKTLKNSTNKKEIMDWINEYLEYTTYEIAIPSIRSKMLAPEGKTGLVVSVLMDYDFIKNIKELGFYEEFKDHTEEKIINVLDSSIYDNIKSKISSRFSSTPLTIERLTNNLDGGITGWAFTNDEIPAINKMTQVKKACYTPVPDIYQAGQWTFSPSGLPICILTGKIAADKVIKELGRKK